MSFVGHKGRNCWPEGLVMRWAFLGKIFGNRCLSYCSNFISLNTIVFPVCAPVFTKFISCHVPPIYCFTEFRVRKMMVLRVARGRLMTHEPIIAGIAIGVRVVDRVLGIFPMVLPWRTLIAQYSLGSKWLDYMLLWVMVRLVWIDFQRMACRLWKRLGPRYKVFSFKVYTWVVWFLCNLLAMSFLNCELRTQNTERGLDAILLAAISSEDAKVLWVWGWLEGVIGALGGKCWSCDGYCLLPLWVRVRSLSLWVRGIMEKRSH